MGESLGVRLVWVGELGSGTSVGGSLGVRLVWVGAWEWG